MIIEKMVDEVAGQGIGVIVISIDGEKVSWTSRNLSPLQSTGALEYVKACALRNVVASAELGPAQP